MPCKQIVIRRKTMQNLVISTWREVQEWMCFTIEEKYAKKKEYGINIRVNFS